MKCMACDRQSATVGHSFCEDCQIEVLEEQLNIAMQDIEDCNVAIYELIVEICYLQEEIKKLQ
jgi:hypothetical protein